MQYQPHGDRSRVPFRSSGWVPPGDTMRSTVEVELVSNVTVEEATEAAVWLTHKGLIIVQKGQ